MVPTFSSQFPLTIVIRRPCGRIPNSHQHRQQLAMACPEAVPREGPTALRFCSSRARQQPDMHCRKLLALSFRFWSVPNVSPLDVPREPRSSLSIADVQCEMELFDFDASSKPRIGFDKSSRPTKRSAFLLIFLQIAKPLPQWRSTR